MMIKVGLQNKIEGAFIKIVMIIIILKAREKLEVNKTITFYCSV